MKLGRPHGPSTLHGAKLAALMNPALLPAPPLAMDVDASLPALIDQYGNDTHGDCTCATWAAVFKSDAAANGKTIDFTTAEILAMYRSSGWDGTPSSDNGWTMQGAASHAQRVGLRDTTGQLHVAGPWLSINWRDIEEVKLAMFMFGALPVGIALPLAYQDTSKPWAAVDGDRGEPGSWGGHSLTAVACDHDGVILRTWGARQRITWAGWMKYVDEVIAKIDPLWCSNTALAPNGFAIEDLIAAQGVLR